MSNNKQVVAAKLALVMDGMEFAVKQMAAGINAFAPVVTLDLDLFRQVLLTQQLDDADNDDEDEPSMNEDEDEDLEDDDTESSITGGEEDIFIAALERLGPAPIDSVSSEQVRPGVSIWKFPSEVCQGRYKGRNGSNACSLISLLTGYTIWLKKMQPPSSHLSISGVFIDFLCGCIELGNRIYDMCRDSLPFRYLSVQEAASVLETWCDISVESNLPVRLKDQHDPSTVGGQLREAVASRESFFAFLILNEKTSLFHVSCGTVMYIDSHSHGSSGAVVVTAKLQDLEMMCQSVWNLEENDGNTFGNLAFVKFGT